jgi:hypothetical protein
MNTSNKLVPNKRQLRSLLAELPDREPYTNPLTGVNRNGICPCGSGKKFKKCCLAAERQSRLLAQEIQESDAAGY